MTPKEKNALMQNSQEVALEDCHFDLSIDDNNDEELEFQALVKYLNGSHQVKTQTWNPVKRESKAMLNIFIKGHILMHLLFLKAHKK